MTRRCRRCGAVDVRYRCSKCTNAFYCGKSCQRFDWATHKACCRVVASYFGAVESALCRVAANQPAQECNFRDAMCYICTMVGTDAEPLVRACACRGASGWAHLSCLMRYARTTTGPSRWLLCGICRKPFCGAVGVAMAAEFWGDHRTEEDEGIRYAALRPVISILTAGREFGVALRVLEDARHVDGGRPGPYLELQTFRIDILLALGDYPRAIDDCQNLLSLLRRFPAPEAYMHISKQLATAFLGDSQYIMAKRTAYFATMFARQVTRSASSLEILDAQHIYARACHGLGEFAKCEAVLNQLLDTERRVYGREHVQTMETISVMASLGITIPLS